jgi:chromosome partition protein MukF
MSTNPRDPHRLLAGLYRDGVSLELSTLDICFLAALYLRAEQDGLASFDEELVLDVFEQVYDLVEPGLEGAGKRATHCIQRLRTQRLLVRVDATGIVSAGEYALTSLANLIIRSFLEEEQLTRESLALLTGAVISSLGQIRAAAQRSADETSWRSEVLAPLRITVGELVGGIERRQRGLDAQQEDVQRRIGELLQSDWFGAVERCQELLETMAGTLQELNAVLLRDSSLIQTMLQEIQQAAASGAALEAEEAAQRVAEQVDRMVAWGASRQQAWSGYYQHVHRFLRDVVRLDPARALTQRLLEQLRSWPARPFALVAAADASMRLLRPISARGEREAVGRPRADREAELVEDSAEDGIDLDALVEDALRDGATDLVSVTRAVILRLDASQHYRMAGRIAAIVARRCVPVPDHERPWTPVSAMIEIEDWALKVAQMSRS